MIETNALLSDWTLIKTNMAQELAEKLMANLSVKAEEGEEEVKPQHTDSVIADWRLSK